MKRTTKIRKADAILTSDWHLRETIPVCRTDDFCQTMWRKVGFISDLQKEHDCVVLHAGDLYDFWKPSPSLLTETVLHISNQFYSVYGQHDLPQHNFELASKSGLFNLWINKSVQMLHCYNWKETPEEYSFCPSITIEDRKIMVWHKFNYQGKSPWPGCTDPTAIELLKTYPQFDLILTGDNHTPFIETFKNRLLVNPGSIFRMDADQIEHKPRVYLWYAETNEVEPVYIPIEEGVVSREHIDLKEKRENRISAFVSHLNDGYKISMNFAENLKRFEKSNKINELVMNIVYKSIEV